MSDDFKPCETALASQRAALLAHLKEHDHNKAFYQLCEHMLPGYRQLEFDTRLYLTWRDLPVPAQQP